MPLPSAPSRLHAAMFGCVALLALAGCQSAAQKANCPVVNVLANTSELFVFRKGMAGDPSGELYTVEMTGAKASCDFDKDEGTTDSSVDITFRASRAPSGDQVNYTVPYFVAQVQNGTTVLNKQIAAAAFSFQPGEAVTTFTANVPSTIIHLQTGHKPYEYGLLVGLQLTREELDYASKRRGLVP